MDEKYDLVDDISPNVIDKLEMPDSNDKSESSNFFFNEEEIVDKKEDQEQDLVEETQVKFDEGGHESLDVEDLINLVIPAKKIKLAADDSYETSSIEIPIVSADEVELFEPITEFESAMNVVLSNEADPLDMDSSEVAQIDLGESVMEPTLLLNVPYDNEDPENVLIDEEDVDDEELEELLDDDEDEDGDNVLEDVESVMSDLISPDVLQEREARKVEDRKLLALLAHFDEDQLNRFETFRRATFAKVSVRRLIQSVCSCSVSQNVVIAMAGLTKVFVGELVEQALIYKEKFGDSGPLQPKHIREAYRHLMDEEKCCIERPADLFFNTFSLS